MTASDPPGSSVLVINAGSSSVKFALVDPDSGERSLAGIAERLGGRDAVLQMSTEGGGSRHHDLDGGDHHVAVDLILQAARDLPPEQRPGSVGHRVVHGGERFTESVVVAPDVVAAIEEFSPLAPLHNPANLLGIRAVSAAWPDVPQVAVFDTSFHQSMPPAAYRYAVPEEWYADHGVRRYGFHGTSHRYVSTRAAALLDRPAEELAMVVAHLGNGCSATAVLGGRSMDTTMGLTPLEGLVMGTRSGDVDPALFTYLASEAALTAAEVTDQLNQRSGLRGLSGIGNDLREIQAAAGNGDERARLAVDVFVHRLAKHLAGLVVSLGRIDALVFTGGIGENSSDVRARTVEALGFLGMELDPAANEDHGKDRSGRVSTGKGPVVLVVPTDEELMIAIDTRRLTGPASSGGAR